MAAMTTHVDTRPLITKYPADQYLRTIEFVDFQPNTGDDPPVHVTKYGKGGVLINGEVRENLWLSAADPVSIEPVRVVRVETNGGLCRSEVLVCLSVWHEHVTVPDYDQPAKRPERGEGGNLPMLDGLICLTPPYEHEAYRWTVDGDWVTVWVMVREVSFRARTT